MSDEDTLPAQGACPDCGRAPGPKGRIRHDEFCPKRTGARPTGEDGATAERAPTRPRTTRGTDRVKLAADIDSGIGMLQGVVFGMVRPDWAPDALTADESQMLSVALADEIASNKRLRDLIARLQKESVHARLLIVVGMIAIPRMMRHGVIPSFGGHPPMGADQSPQSPTYGPLPSDGGEWVDLDMTDGHAAVPPVGAAA